MKKQIVGVTMGDPAGIGPEIIVKALTRYLVFKNCIPIVVGSKNVIKDAIDFTGVNLEVSSVNRIDNLEPKTNTIQVIDLNNINLCEFEYGKVSKKAGEASVQYILKAIELIKNNKIDAITTGPIHKEAIAAAGYDYPGHTEILADKTKTEDFAMMLTHKNMRVIHVSTHVALKEACNLVKEVRIFKVIKLAYKALNKLGIKNPTIGVAGLNPHAGEHGLFGKEENKEIIPAIKKAEKEGITIKGPESPDTVFSKLIGGIFDIVVVMYHDQGHIPMKVTGFKYNKKRDEWSSVSGVNTTVGLPFIRTSVDHGTAFDKAGEGKASEDSMVEAIKMATDFLG